MELVASYVAGSNVRELVQHYNVHETTIRAHLKRSGIELRTYRKLSPADIRETRELRASGMPLAEVASMFGVTASTVRRVLAELDET